MYQPFCPVGQQRMMQRKFCHFENKHSLPLSGVAYFFLKISTLLKT